MASSHINKGTSRSRRSWFDTPPLTTLDPIPAPKAVGNPKRASIDTVEVLTLTHFTNPPKIIFGKTCIGKTKVRTLLLRNPHDFDQEVIIEKFPYKKKFMVNQTRFIVNPDEVFSLEITWTPVEDGGFREMIQFHVNDVYRLQAFVIGSAEKPKAPRKTRKFPVVPFVRQQPTVLQTPALTDIRKNYSPTNKQEAYKEIEHLVNQHNENKENIEKKAQLDTGRVIDVKDGNVIKWNWESPTPPIGQIKSHVNMQNEVGQTPTPLESTTIVSKHDINAKGLKNKRQWQHITGMPSSSLNMSPIPVSEGNEHGIIVDSYFQSNEIGTMSELKKQKPKQENVETKSAKLDKCFEVVDANLKETFVMPLQPENRTKSRKGPVDLQKNITISSELVSSSTQQNQQLTRADETRVIQLNETKVKSSTVYGVGMELARPEISSVETTQAVSSWSPPKLPRSNIFAGANEVSPRTLLDESLTLISRMKVRDRSTETSLSDNNASINSSLISQGQGIVSPNSFMEDMRSLVQTGEVAAAGTPGSPSLISNNSVPHKTLVDHLLKIRRSLHNSPKVSKFDCGTPKMSQAARYVPKRRSITSQFQKDEMRKIKAAARSVKRDQELLADHKKQQTIKGFTTMKSQVTKKYCKSATEPNLAGQSSSSDQQLGLKKKKTEKITALTKRSPKGKRSPVSRRSPLARKGLRSSFQDFAMKKSRSNVNRRKSPLKPYMKGIKSEQHSHFYPDTNPVKTLSNDACVTPQKENYIPNSCSDANYKSFDSNTVVKSKSHENTAEISGRMFDFLHQDENEQKTDISRNVHSREKLFPDIQIADYIEGDNINEDNIKVNTIKEEPCKDHCNISPVMLQVNKNDYTIIGTDLKNTIEGEMLVCGTYSTQLNNEMTRCLSSASVKDELKTTIFHEAETAQNTKTISSNNFTSPKCISDQSKRETIKLTNSRISLALTAAMKNENRIIMNTPTRSSPCCSTENTDNTETHENIRVEVEEHYQEINGSMYVIVKETTNVTKSTTETYMEQLGISPQHFRTPTRLPNSPDHVVCRRSTHVVRSPKVINTTALNKRQINFIQGEDNSKTDHTELKKSHMSELIEEEINFPEAIDDNNITCSAIRSDTFEKEPTFIETPIRHFISDRSDHPITSVCTMSPCLVDYENGSDESRHSGDVTKDSLDTNQSVDSLVSPANQTNLAVDENELQINQGNNVDMEVTVSNYENKSCKDEHETNLLSNCDSKQDFTVSALKEKNINSGKQSTQASDESEDDQFHDTMSERYYDALSDDGNVEVGRVTDVERCVEEALTKRGSVGEIADIKDVVDTYESFILKEADETAAVKRYVEEVLEISNETGENNSLPSHNWESNKRCSDLDNFFGFDKSNHLEMQEVQNNMLEKSIYNMDTYSPLMDIGLQSLDLNKIETQSVERSIDHKEKFEVTERECFNLCSVSELEPVEDIVRSTPEAKIKRKLRRSISADNLLENKLSEDKLKLQKQQKSVNFDCNSSTVGKIPLARKALAHSKSVVLTETALQSSARFSPVKIPKDHRPSSPKIDVISKQRSQSLSNLSKQIDKTSMKNDNRSSDKKRPLSKGSQVMQTVSKPKGSIKGVPQGRLILVKKKPNAAIPRHPMLFAAKNMYYDERWMEKQERGFVQWLNFVLTPPDEYVAVMNKTKVDAGSLALDTGHVAPRLAPTKEILSFRSYAARRRLNRLRKSACELYQSESVVNIIHKIEVEVESRRICIRKDKMVHVDVGIKQKLLDLLLHYSSLWLRIGLETIFGEVLMLQSNQDVLGLSRFILTRLLASPDIAAEFAHPTVPHFYKQGFEAALSRHTIKKFLLLVYFLDRAKSSRLIDHDPCLFCKDASIKSSKEILIEFSREVLSGEGDITRHLTYLGYTICQSQKPIDEFDFGVTNLGSDLRDGLRLCRVLELLAGDQSIMGKLRTPAISRLQKIHNTGVFFKVMSERGLDLSSMPGTKVTAKDLVDGHREKTLALLWQLIIYFQGSIQVNEAHLKEEIDILTKSLQLKVAMQKIGAMSVTECEARRDSGETKLVGENKMLQLILHWCRLVCLHYGVKVENFTVSFSDGRALCCLLHHYHPALLPLSEINFQTTISCQEMAENSCQIDTNLDLSVDWGRYGGGLMPNENNAEMIEQMLVNEKSNFKILYDKVSALGGVPLMLKYSDMSNTIPNEKVLSTFVSYLCARLLDIREEVRAARILQMAWRRKQLQRAIHRREIRTKAAVTIQRWIRPHLKKQIAVRQNYAATRIQSVWRGYSVRILLEKLKLSNQEAAWNEKKDQLTPESQSLWKSCYAQNQPAQLKENEQRESFEEKAAITIQKFTKGILCRKEFAKKQASIIKIQSFWRKCLAQKMYNRLKQDHLNHSAVIIQKWMQRHYCMSMYSRQKAAAIIFQKYWRRKQAMVKLDKLLNEKHSEEAAIVIQKFVRGKLMRKKFQLYRRATIALQSSWRGKQCRKELSALKFEKENQAAVLIQNFMKSVICQCKYLKIKKSISIIQRNWRKILAQRTLVSLKMERNKALALQTAAVILQKTWRMYQARKELKYLKHKRQEHSATVIQQYYRKFKCSQNIQKLNSAALRIQTAWRMHQAMKVLAKLKHNRRVLSAIVIQKFYKGFVQRRNYTALKSAAIVVQKCWRMIKARRQLKKLWQQKREKSAVVIQKNVRMWKDKRYFQNLKSAAIVMQSNRRRIQAKRHLSAMRLRKQEKSATLIQKIWRGVLARQVFLTKRKAILKIQSYLRMFQARKQFWLIKDAVFIIQTWHRANLEGKKQKSLYMKQRQSVICIQRWWRCQNTSRQFQIMRHAAVVIQKAFRCFRCRQRFLMQKFAAIIIQNSVRHYLSGLEVRKKYLTMRQAAVTIQKSIRRHLQEKHVRQEAAALVLQTAFRKTNARRKFIKQKNAALTIQKRFREYLEMKNLRGDFLCQRQAACVIQRNYRALVIKRQRMHFHNSVIKLQAHIRTKIFRDQFFNLKNAAIVIQRRFKAYKLGHDYRMAFLHLRTSAIVIQRFYRAVQARKKVEREIANQHSAATKIQTNYRGWSQKRDYRLLRAATVILQRRYRSHLVGQMVRNRFRKTKESVCLIQRRWRSYKQICDAKRIVQKLEAEWKQRQEEKLMKERNEKIVRDELERKVEEMRRKAAAVVLQKSIRAWLNVKNNRRQHAALVIQKHVRGHLNRIKYRADVKHILYLQRLVKGFYYRRKYERMRLAARIIQTRWREITEGRHCRSEFLTKREAVVKIQAYFQMRRQQKIYETKVRSVVIIQLFARASIQRQRYQNEIKSIIRMQRRVKSILQMRQVRESFLKIRHSVIKIQTIVRLWLAYRRVHSERLSVLKPQISNRLQQRPLSVLQACEDIQDQKLVLEACCQQLDKVTDNKQYMSLESSFQSKRTDTSHFGANIVQRTIRCYLNKHYEQQTKSAFVIQKAVRNYVCRRKMIRNKCAVKLQANIRMFLCRRNYLCLCRSVIVLQAAVRGWQARKLFKSLKRHRAVVCLQAVIRGFLVRRRLSPELENRLQILHEQTRWNKAASKIQALWRGYVTRRNIKDRRLTHARKRIQDANREATNEKTLGYRTSSALDYLLREKNLAFILEALMNLEVSTRLSPKCCEKMAEMNAVSVLYRLINSCNRSVPHMELIKYSVNILLNLAKYEKTIDSVLKPPESISSIVELLQIYREKSSIFNICCMLLWMLGHHPERRVHILKHPLIVDRIQSLHVLSLRKQRTSQNRQVAQAKMAAMKNMNYTMPVMTPSKSKRRVFRPDWALAGDSMKAFDDPVVAVSNVMEVLQIRPKV